MRDRCKLSFACPVAASSPAYVLVWLASLAQIGELSRSLLQDKSSKPEISIYTYWKLTKAAIQRVAEHCTDTVPQTLIDSVKMARWLYNIVLSGNKNNFK